MVRDKFSLYTVIPSVLGGMSKWENTLLEVKDMGFDCVHFLPLTMMGGSKSPYSASDLFVLDNRYIDNGTGNCPRELEKLFDKTGISFCADLVMNHVATEGNFAEKFPSWLKRRDDGSVMNAGFWGNKGWEEWGDLALIDYEHPDIGTRKEIWDYMLNYAKLWSGIADRTRGLIRFDNLHSTNEGFLEYLLGNIHDEFPDLTITGEMFDFPEKMERFSKKLGIDFFLATQWENKFVPDLRRYIGFLHNTKGAKYFLPISTHDSGVPAQEYGCVQSVIPRYAISGFFGMGGSGSVQGVERGVKQKVNFIGDECSLGECENVDFRNYMKFVNDLSGKKVFHKRGNLKFIDNNHHAIMGISRSFGKERVIVMANFDIHSWQSMRFYPKNFGIDFNNSLMPEIRGFNEIDNGAEFYLSPCSVKVIDMKRNGYVSYNCEYDNNRRGVKISECRNL